MQLPEGDHPFDPEPESWYEGLLRDELLKKTVPCARAGTKLRVEVTLKLKTYLATFCVAASPPPKKSISMEFQLSLVILATQFPRFNL